MSDQATQPRRRIVTDNIRNAIDAIERADATGIKILAGDGVSATGDWAVLQQNQVTVYQTTARGAATSVMLLDDVLAVQTLWIDAAPPFVAPSRFDAAFDQAFVEAVGRVLGREIVATATATQPSLLKTLDEPKKNGTRDMDAVHADVRASLGSVLRVKPDAPASAILVDLEMIERSKEAARLVKMLPEDYLDTLRQTNGGVVTIARIMETQPVIATALAIDWLRVEAKIRLPIYSTRVALDGLIEGNVSMTFSST